ncbi:sigma-70 family RNA polymerase sigma factor [Amycolatopsis sp. NPDC051903]|uniref:sigma-70 family RNA polymerase sigma factor n=1 Tax=Amycolatopsis sp. NPDC051903 TaxID=3363936 RepID=UPI0037A4532A
MDHESAEWVRVLSAGAPGRDEAVALLHAKFLRIAGAEVARRGARRGLAGTAADDLVQQAATDALVTVLAKLSEFRGESRFTSWAYKFVVFAVSNGLAHHFRRTSPDGWEIEDWSAFPDRFGLSPDRHAEWQDLVLGIRKAVHEELSDRQRRVFTALVLGGVPLDALGQELGTNRNALYKTLYDARRKIRARLVAEGHLDDTGGRQA